MEVLQRTKEMDLPEHNHRFLTDLLHLKNRQNIPKNGHVQDLKLLRCHLHQNVERRRNGNRKNEKEEKIVHKQYRTVMIVRQRFRMIQNRKEKVEKEVEDQHRKKVFLQEVLAQDLRVEVDRDQADQIVPVSKKDFLIMTV